MGIMDVLFPASFSSSSPTGPHNGAARFAARPRDYFALRPLATSQGNTTAYLAVATEATAYGSTSYAFPAPLITSVDKSLFSAAVLMASSPLNTSSISEIQVVWTLFRARELLTDVHRVACSDSPLRARESAGPGPFTSTLDVVVRACEADGTLRLVCAGVEEVAGVETGRVRVTGVLYVARSAMCGESDADEASAVRVECLSPAVAVSLAAAAGVPCFILRDLFDVTSVRVSNFDSCGLHEPAVVEAADTQPPVPPMEVGQGGACGDEDVAVTPWECDSVRALGLSEDTLRVSLRAVGVAVVMSESRDSLLRKFVSLMDETERREVLIQIAASKEMFGLAGELQAGRSERGKLREQMQKTADVNELFQLQREANRRREQLADPTQEPGSYDPYLDQDPWYKPSR
jgi:hypothetical protein